jgi:hypothetical protein
MFHRPAHSAMGGACHSLDAVARTTEGSLMSNTPSTDKICDRCHRPIDLQYGCGCAPARTWQEQVANIQRNLAAKTMSCDRDTHRVNNPIWEEEKP